LIIDDWTVHGMRDKKFTKPMTSGWHEIKVAHFENSHGAGLEFTYIGPDTENKKVYLKAKHDDGHKKTSGRNLGWVGRHFFFNYNPGPAGYDIEGIAPNVTKGIT
jgi:hypothetical protein